MGLKAKIEAILFLNPKPLTAPEIATQANADLDDVRTAISQLVQDYEERQDCGLMIDTAEGYSLQVREDYENLSQDILEIELKTGCLRTLSVIALKEPIFQSQLVDMRGGGAYEHIKELSDMGLIKKVKDGHKHLLKTTQMFSEYFRMTENGIELQSVLKKHSERVKFTRGAEFEEGAITEAAVQEIQIEEPVTETKAAWGEASEEMTSELTEVANQLSEELEANTQHAV